MFCSDTVLLAIVLSVGPRVRYRAEEIWVQAGEEVVMNAEKMAVFV